MPAPDLFTVNEAAIVLRIGRTAAYELARRDLASNGGEGLGVVRIGGQLRVPRASLERIVAGPISWPAEHITAPGSADVPIVATRAAAPSPAARARREARDTDPMLPFPA